MLAPSAEGDLRLLLEQVDVIHVRAGLHLLADARPSPRVGSRYECPVAGQDVQKDLLPISSVTSTAVLSS
jgi:hypothetical protein